MNQDQAILNLLSSNPTASNTDTETNNSELTPVMESEVKAASSDLDLNKLSLKDLINPALLAKLNNLSDEQLETLSLKELLTAITQEALAGPWVITELDGVQALQTEYELGALWKARYLVGDLMGKACSMDVCPEELSLNKTEDDKFLLKIRILNKTVDKSNSALAFAQYVNYRVTSQDDPYANDYYAQPEKPEELSTSSLNKTATEPLNKEEAEQTLVESLSAPTVEDEQYVSCISRVELLEDLGEGETTTKKIRLAAAKLGKWKHPLYKVVEFTDKDFDDAIENFNNRVLGFEPPLFLGHANNTVSSGSGIAYETSEGAPAEGFLLNLYKEGDVLYSEWEIVNDLVYEAVKAKRYRYNSGEFVRGFRSKDDGSNVGMVVIGMALTNRPFVPDLPHAKALSEQQIRPDSSISFRLSFKEEIVPPEINSSVTTEPDINLSVSNDPQELSLPMQDQDKENTQELSLAQLVEQQGKELQAVKAAYEQQLSEALSQVQTLSTQVAEAKEQLRKRDIDEKLAWLNKLALPADVKESYSDLIKSGSLGASEAAVLKTLESTSQAFSNSVTAQQGASEETEKLNDPLYADPYADVIKRNTEIANKLREANFAIK